MDIEQISFQIISFSGDSFSTMVKALGKAKEKKFDEAAKHYGVTAELFVNDAELKPKALFKAAEALDKAGRKSEASQYRARLQKEFPDWKQDGESLPPDAR